VWICVDNLILREGVFFVNILLNMNKKIISIIAGVIVVVGVGYYVYVDMTPNPVIVDTTDITKKEEIQGDISIEGKTVEGDRPVTIKSVKNESIPVPNLDKKIVFNKNIPIGTQDILRQNIQTISQELKKDSNLPDNWIELGTYRKNIGDYVGSVEALNYAIYLNPSNSVAYNNIGDLYAYFLKNDVLAEQNFLKALEVAPKDLYLYFKVSEFYTDVLKNPSAARAIVEQGVEENPNSTELKDLLNSL
jgi:tetratricopeptide (TPR) repeat protein